MKKIIDLKLATRLINNGCTVLVSTRGDGKDNIMTVAWLMPLAKDPPLVALAIGQSKFSYKLIQKTGQFAINVPNKDLAPQTMICGRHKGFEVDKFELSGLTARPAQKLDVPLVDECFAHLECRLRETFILGKSAITVGEVVCAQVEDELFDSSVLIGDDRAKTLHHLGGAKFCFPGEPFVSTAENQQG